MYKFYRIEEGENLDLIAKKYNITETELRKINDLEDHEIVSFHQFIMVPGLEETTDREDSYFDKYVIRQEDTISQLAHRYHVREKDLLNLNGLKEMDYIYTGEEIMVPKEGIIIYITSDEETLKKIAEKTKMQEKDIIANNKNIYLKSEQLLIIKK